MQVASWNMYGRNAWDSPKPSMGNLLLTDRLVLLFLEFKQWSLPHNHAGPVSPMGDLVWYASQQEALEAAKSSTADNNDIQVIVFGIIDNAFSRISFDQGRLNMPDTPLLSLLFTRPKSGFGLSFLDADERRLFPNSGFRHSELGSKILNIKNKRLLKASIEFKISLVMVFLKRSMRMQWW